MSESVHGLAEALVENFVVGSGDYWGRDDDLESAQRDARTFIRKLLAQPQWSRTPPAEPGLWLFWDDGNEKPHATYRLSPQDISVGWPTRLDGGRWLPIPEPDPPPKVSR